jgi:ketosteroid isomerase-like protein
VARQREVVDAFLAASRGGDFQALLSLLDPDIVLRADAAAARLGAPAELRGADAVAATFSGRAQGARPALIDGEPGAVWAVGGTPRVVFTFTIAWHRIVAIEMHSDPELMAELEISR